MGIIKQRQLEEAEREHNRRMRELEVGYVGAGDLEEVMEAEDYEAFMRELEKDD